MSRAARRANVSVKSMLEEAELNLLAAFKKSSGTIHKGLKGDSRAKNVADFLEKRLPSGYGVLCKGEVVDYLDQRSGEMDIVVFDKVRNAMLSDEPLWIPAESLLAYIEVKSVLTEDELRKAYAAAQKVGTLRPFKRSFSIAGNDTYIAEEGGPQPGKSSVTGPLRCFRTVFAYTTNLKQEDWLSQEWKRVTKVTNEIRCTPAQIDRILVLDRGLINPPAKRGADEFVLSSAFSQWFINLVNFLSCENGRRPPVDWQTYSKMPLPGWRRLD
jgi:hypothetical protein